MSKYQNRKMKWYEKPLDSYDHYRRHVGCGVFYALYRTWYYETFHKEPKKWRGAPL
jgi:hypothetical protein